MKVQMCAAIALIALGMFALWLFSRNSIQAKPQITLRSDPYPLVIGPTTLRVAVNNSDGTPVVANISVAGHMMHEGMLPLNIQTIKHVNGEYRIPVIWPMMGQWTLDVSAELPNNQGVLKDQFDVYVYATEITLTTGQNFFRSLSQSQALFPDPAHELGIVIPQGTKMLMMEGQADDVIPEVINLNVSGRNTLVIQNDDIVDHTVGPYMVRAGEMIRQTFTRPTTYQGTCSANLRSKISIIVDA